MDTTQARVEAIPLDMVQANHQIGGPMPTMDNEGNIDKPDGMVYCETQLPHPLDRPRQCDCGRIIWKPVDRRVG